PEPPWQHPGPRDGLGHEGLEVIRTFVANGGRYLGVGSGGGILASTTFLGLVDAEIVDEMLGEARAVIQITQNHPVVDGLGSLADDAGRTTMSRMAVPYSSEPVAASHGGPIFRPGAGAQVLAEYVAIDDPTSLRAPEFFDAKAHTPAILYQTTGHG